MNIREAILILQAACDHEQPLLVPDEQSGGTVNAIIQDWGEGYMVVVPEER